ncbi:zinc ribbon domain-containing protein [Streptosporangium sp. NPDC000396]|uniref:zinc ribbon domain-containing protein n=1 Tax=Streptosporangium sp. NPDC000396 TaxID=3366185 RepID=UPI0036A25875
MARLEDKAPGRVVRVNPAYTSQRCSACGIVDPKSRQSQAAFRCRSCGYVGNADVNAARNIHHAAGHAVSAREGPGVAGPVHREPQRVLLTGRSGLESLALQAREDVKSWRRDLMLG